MKWGHVLLAGGIAWLLSRLLRKASLFPAPPVVVPSSTEAYKVIANAVNTGWMPERYSCGLTLDDQIDRAYSYEKRWPGSVFVMEADKYDENTAVIVYRVAGARLWAEQFAAWLRAQTCIRSAEIQ